MNKNNYIRDLGEVNIIRRIKDLILKKTGKELNYDDSFFFSIEKKNLQNELVLNSDMFVSTTDAPKQMNFHQIGRKSVLMNISDLMVKGVIPKGIILSLGLPEQLCISSFDHLMEGIIDYCKKWNLEYVGGDINKTQELIISPTIFGFKKRSRIITRSGIQVGDILLANGKFGLTSVGFDILINKKDLFEKSSKYKKAILSVLEPEDPGYEGYILSNNGLATSSIDSSDGLIKSLRDLMECNSQIGFEIKYDENLLEEEVLLYSQEFEIPLEKLIFEGGEEFIQIFTIKSNNLETACKKVKEEGGKLFEIGSVISEKKIYFRKGQNKFEVESRGFEHFK